MTDVKKKTNKHLILLIISVFLFSTNEALSEDTAHPPFGNQIVPPLLMLVMSKDHKMFYKAYTDYSDLDDPADGTLETTYKHSIDYFGYFDPYKCYSYSGGIFEPQSVTGSKTCSSKWSGNFLNWATMARIDTMRKVLYGGYRYTDDDGTTVLERTFIPQDAHSWVKVYTPDTGDTSISALTPFSKSSISICNTTKDSYNNPPLIRVAENAWSRWASSERWQCALKGEKNADYDSLRPNSTTDFLGDYIARVKVCVAGLTGTENCKEYPNSNLKPVGLLQEFGEDDSIYFGLMTGSWEKNKSGGVLRKNISSITDEIDANSGIFTNTAGIIDTINKIKIYRYNYTDGTYNSTDNCIWGEATFTDGRCTNWGNPVSEIYYEALRYFSGKGSFTSDYDANDSSIAGLNPVAWDDPYAGFPYCSKPSIMVLSDISPSFDSDQIGSDITGLDAVSETNAVGSGEGISGDYFIGYNGSTSDNFCTSKSVSNLGLINGLCPTEPAREGSYLISGLSYWANTNDLRTDLTDDGFEQSVKTYSIALSSSLPEINISVGGSTAKMIPACVNRRIENTCALVDFRVVTQTATSGSFYVNWEDSEQGGDYDMDADGYINYTINADNTVTFTVEIHGNSTGFKMELGYVISGTTDDGVHFLAANCSGDKECRAPWFDNFTAGQTATSNANSGSLKHTPGTTSASFLKDPLWYAAKWGGFNDKDDDNLPNLTSEWDDNNDGDPDKYFFVANPSKLEKQIRKALFEVLQLASSGTAASVVAATGDGEGAVYQAYHYPEKQEDLEVRKWLGYLRALSVDKYGNIDLVNPIWDAGQWLWQKNPSQRNIYTTLRGYDFETETADLTVQSNLGNFHIGNKINLQPYLRAADNDSNAEAQNIIKWIRGDDLTAGTTDAGHPDGYRQRSITGIDSQGNSTKLVWKLGDIVYSTPTPVGKPMENYDLLYGDSTYTTFRKTYLNRRQVVYAGANDGMLHAFNAGCYDETNLEFSNSECTDSKNYDLGEEIWTFIPRGLLPHLKSLTDPNYNHEYYVDLKPKITDVQIFDCGDGVHVGANPDTGKCWGTILISGFRYGGKSINWTSGGTDYIASPEYFAFDITDPSEPRLLWTFPENPKLLSSFSDPGLGLSMSYPAVAKIGNEWFAIFGSGATDFNSVSDLNLTSLQNGNIFVLKISAGNNGIIDNWNSKYSKISTGNSNTFMADPITIDIDMDNDVDVIYIGENIYDANNSTWNAIMHRITTNKGTELTPSNWIRSTLANIDDIGNNMGGNDVVKRITSAPSAAMDDMANLWLFFGTGQFLGTSDKNQTDTGAFYAIKDGCWDPTNVIKCPAPAAYNDLYDASNIEICAGGGIACGGTNFNTVNTDAAAKDGWVIYFDSVGENQDFTGETLAHDGERVLSKPLVLGGLVTWGTYIHGNDVCAGGESNVYAVYYKTGTAYKEYIFEEQKEQANPSDIVARVKKFGPAMPSAPSAQTTSEGTVKIFFQGGDATISGIEGNTPYSLTSDVTGWKNECIQ